MAVSLGFGVLFATFVVLLRVPACYLMLHEALALLGFGELVVLPPSNGDAGSTDAVAQPAQ